MGLSQIEDQLANNFQRLDGLQGRKQQSIHRFDIQVQQQKVPTLESTVTTHLPSTVAAEDITETSAATIRPKKLKKHSTKASTTTTSAESDDEEEVSTTPRSTVDHVFLKLSKKTVAATTKQTTTVASDDSDDKNVASTTRGSIAARLGGIRTETTTEKGVDRLPRTWTLPENDSLDTSTNPVVQALEAQLQENWKKIEKFQEVRRQKQKATTMKASTTTVASVTADISDADDSQTDEEDDMTTTQKPSTMLRRKAPFKKASWTNLQQAVQAKASAKQILDQEERIRLALGAVQSSFRDKVLTMTKRDMAVVNVAQDQIGAPAVGGVDVAENLDGAAAKARALDAGNDTVATTTASTTTTKKATAAGATHARSAVARNASHNATAPRAKAAAHPPPSAANCNISMKAGKK